MTLVRRCLFSGLKIAGRRAFSSSSSRKADYTHVVVGAGVVGLAIARRLASRENTSTLLIDRHESVGTETSSRNSEVIHAGIYYGPDSLKTKLCIEGKDMLYDLCRREGIPYRNTGKWVVAQDADQHEQLQKTHDLAKSLDVPVQFITLDEAKRREPDVLAKQAVLESPTTGIVDSHAFMSFLESDIQDRGGDIACNTIVQRFEPLDSGKAGWTIETRSGSFSEVATITTESIINSAGLGAIALSNSIVPASRHLKPLFAKGSYFSYSGPSPRPKMLIYPAPRAGLAGLGTHLTLDMAGQIRFGPDVEWVDDPTDLRVNESNLQSAIQEIQAYLPSVNVEKIQPDYCGIRPKLGKGGALAGAGFNDFVIRKEAGFEGFVNLLGIESPGLTSSLAIAEMVHRLLYD